MSVSLSTLRPGRRFQLVDCRRCGTLLEVTEFGATVRYEGVKQRTFTAQFSRNGVRLAQPKQVTVTQRGEVKTISAETRVEVLHG